jgi:hypothetical protein
VQEDFQRNKILVCANLSNIFHTYQVSKLYNPKTQTMDKQQAHLSNFFDYDKWIKLYDPNSPQQPAGEFDDSPVVNRKGLARQGSTYTYGTGTLTGGTNLPRVNENTAEITEEQT